MMPRAFILFFLRTVLDKVMLICFGSIFFVGLESFVVFLLVKHPSGDGHRMAKIVDSHVRYLYPILFVVSNSHIETP